MDNEAPSSLLVPTDRPAEDPVHRGTNQAGMRAQNERLVLTLLRQNGALAKAYSLFDQSDEDWQQTYDINLMSMVRLSRIVARSMISREYGRIVNIGSKAGRYGSYIDGPSYCAIKGAIHALTLQMAAELGKHAITCNTIAPGMIMSERVRKLWESRRPAEEREAIRKAIPLQRHGVPEDVAGVAAFLASEDAAFMTGTILDVNGGQSFST